jgi:hypothetical protein
MTLFGNEVDKPNCPVPKNLKRARKKNRAIMSTPHYVSFKHYCVFLDTMFISLQRNFFIYFKLFGHGIIVAYRVV